LTPLQERFVGYMVKHLFFQSVLTNDLQERFLKRLFFLRRIYQKKLLFNHRKVSKRARKSKLFNYSISSIKRLVFLLKVDFLGNFLSFGKANRSSVVREIERKKFERASVIMREKRRWFSGYYAMRRNRKRVGITRRTSFAEFIKNFDFDKFGYNYNKKKKFIHFHGRSYKGKRSSNFNNKLSSDNKGKDVLSSKQFDIRNSKPNSRFSTKFNNLNKFTSKNGSSSPYFVKGNNKQFKNS
jgi:hypothetical protein